MTALTVAEASASRALATPTILAAMMEHLQRDRADLWTCCRVSKLWRDTAHPLIMRHLNIPFKHSRMPLDEYHRLERYNPKHVHTIRLYDEDIQTIYIDGASTNLVATKTSWRCDGDRPASVMPEDELDTRLAGLRATIERIAKSEVKPQVELVFGIISSAQIERILDANPVILRYISAILVVCDFVRKKDHPNLDRHQRGRLNERFPLWFSQLSSLLWKISNAQRGARRLKDVRVETPIRSSASIKPAMTHEVIFAFSSICDGLEVLVLEATSEQITPAGIKAVLKMSYPRLRGFIFRFQWPQATDAGVDAVSSWLDEFLDRHQELTYIHIETGGDMVALTQTFPRLRSLVLAKTTVHRLESFLSRHRGLDSVSIGRFDVPSDLDAPTVKFEDLPAVTSWEMDYQVLTKLLSRGVPMKMASASGLRSLEDWTVPANAPVPGNNEVPHSTLTYLSLEIKSEDLLSMLVQLGSVFHYIRYPNLRELHLHVNLGDNAPSFLNPGKDHSEAAKCLKLVFSGLSSAIHLNALGLTIFPASSLPPDSLLNQIAQNPPPRLEHLVWSATKEGRVQTYTVQQQEWADGQWSRRYLRTTSRTHIPADLGVSTLDSDPCRPFLDHSYDPPVCSLFPDQTPAALPSDTVDC
ncbi:hypothetical protein OC845_006060 [Tilletia horrida]|nr:hypothetical protein OC845_006060 [Tilletia horrida]